MGEAAGPTSAGPIGAEVRNSVKLDVRCDKRSLGAASVAAGLAENRGMRTTCSGIATSEWACISCAKVNAVNLET